MSEFYNRYFSTPIPGEGVKIHIEVFVDNWADAVRLVWEHAHAIKNDYDNNGLYYLSPEKKEGKLIKVEMKEDPLTVKENFS